MVPTYPTSANFELHGRSSNCTSTLTYIREQTFDGIELEAFIENVWGIHREIVANILSTPCVVDPACLRRYMESYDSSDQYGPPLKWFQILTNTLLHDLKVALGESSPQDKPSKQDEISRQNLLTVDSIVVIEDPRNKLYNGSPITEIRTCATSTSSSPTVIGQKRKNHASIDDTGNEKRSRINPDAFTRGEELLLSDASFVMSVSSRYFITAIHVDRTTATLWYLDRSCVIRSVTFDFVRSPQMLALVAYAIHHPACNLGFDPHLICAGTTSNSQRVAQLEGAEIFFPSIFSDEAGVRFKIVQEALVYSSLRLLGRGTTVYHVVDRENQKLALKMSWLHPTRNEASYLLRLFHSLPAYRNNLPRIIHHDVYCAKEIELPREKLLPWYDHYFDRNLAVLVTPMYQHLWEVDNIEEFKTAFIHCITCHHHAYRSGRVLHRDISENNLMFHRSTSGFKGILNDWDMAALIDHKGVVPADPDFVQPTGTTPFMAIELLRANAELCPHRYEHDLESFFYLLVWATVHFEISQSVRLPTRPCAVLWQGPYKSAAIEKRAFLYSERRMETWRAEIVPEFRQLWKDWILPLRELFAHTPPGGAVGFGNVMAVLQDQGASPGLIH